VSDDRTPTWKSVLACVYVCVCVLLVVVFAGRIGPDFWPLDRSFVGPNIVASVVTVLVATPVGVLLWPPTRRSIHAFVDRKIAPIHAKIDALDGKHDAHAADLKAIKDHLGI
jgi:hypothetical protein